jgi:hypothetical protein
MNITPINRDDCECQMQTTRTTNLNDRPRYYARQLVTPEDLTLEQDYFRAKLRRHNRFLHGWGVVCGARVVLATQPWMVIVKKGYILGPYGDEICIEKDQCIDVRKLCQSSQPGTPLDDGCCTEAAPPLPPGSALFVAIRYVENRTRLVRVPLGGCGCEASSCEYTRYTDGYEICVLDHCPDSHKHPPKLQQVIEGEPPDCPDCPTEPWVVLSQFTVDEKGKVALQECACRRQVISFANFWWSCVVAEPQPAPGPAPTTNSTPTQPATPSAPPVIT